MGIIEDTKQKMQQAYDHLGQELRNLRTSRANPAMVEGIKVEVYGTTMKLKELAAISAPEPRMLLINPFDAQTSGPIVKAIDKANLNLQAIADGNQIRVPIPSLTEDVRKTLVKEAKKKGEDSKISVREIRRKSNELVKKQKSDGEITEDDVKRAEKKIQELTNEKCISIDKLVSEKEKDLMEV